MKHILDKGFKYTPALDTDIRRTFDRLKREQQKRAREKAEKVTQLPRTNQRRSS